MADKPKRSWRDDPEVVRLTEEILRLNEEAKGHAKEAAVAERLLSVAEVRPVAELQRDVDHDLAPPPAQVPIDDLMAQVLEGIREAVAELQELQARRDELEAGEFEALRDQLRAVIDTLLKTFDR